MPKFTQVVVVVDAFAGSIVALGAAPGGAATNRGPHRVGGAVAPPTGDGYWLVYADGAVVPYAGARSYGDASSLPLNGPIVGGTATPDGMGYWLVCPGGGGLTSR